MCKTWTNTIAALVIVIWNIWPTLLFNSTKVATGVISIAALVIIIASWSMGCDCCCCEDEKPKAAGKAKRRR